MVRYICVTRREITCEDCNANQNSPCTIAAKTQKSLNREISTMHGILGSTWPKMTLASYLKVKEETLLVYCLYFVGFLVRSLSVFDCEFANVFFSKCITMFLVL